MQIYEMSVGGYFGGRRAAFDRAFVRGAASRRQAGREVHRVHCFSRSRSKLVPEDAYYAFEKLVKCGIAARAVIP